ncbi:amidohydrolase family protein [Phreatobacter stygius]|uniref:Amidohydrolase n=1 Tax=Phreatobacter stygius TaxID=1940610 RepID=A0A4D7B245_9HYPH|nr:amidohydrolase family protein [Phreatobacter stygius]QCI64130.1 amidohydrolase [Phreatobacter stygius]
MTTTEGTALPRLTAPANACDTHLHVYDPAYPLAPTAASKPPADATAAHYLAVRARLGLTRAVIVQPSVYGTDNACTLAGIAALGREVARGVAVVDDQASEAHLAALTAGGMRGARFLMMPGGAIPWDQLDRIAAKVQSVGWHVQLQMDGRLLHERIAQIRSWPGRIVIDHVGKFLEPVPVDSPAFRLLLELVASGRVWVKLAAPYEVSKTGGPRYEDVSRLARALVKAAPERMLWASNWPHPGINPRPDAADLLDILADWAPDEADRRRILVDNTAQVYGF